MKKIPISSLGALVKSNQRMEEFREQMVTGGKWLRICQFTGGAGAFSGGGILRIVSDYNNNHPSALLITFSVAMDSVGINLLHKNGSLFSKGRIVYRSAVRAYYIDLYTSSTLANNVRFQLSNCINFRFSDYFTEGIIPENHSNTEFMF